MKLQPLPVAASLEPPANFSAPLCPSSADDPAPSEHDETTYENSFQTVLVAMVARNHPVTMASFSSVVDT